MRLTLCFLATLVLIVGLLLPCHSQVKYEWKEMASLDYYDAKFPTFWNYFGGEPDRRNEVKEYIRIARELGFNMVRIPLHFIPRDFTQPWDPHPPAYDHGWVDPSAVGTGKVFRTAESQTYLKHINEMIAFCAQNKMRVHLVLFSHGLETKNSPARRDAKGNIDNFYVKGKSPTLKEINDWFIDATHWIDCILKNIDVSQVEVCEVMSEAIPTNTIAEASYPREFLPDIFLLEMTNYLHHRWPKLKLMLSLHQKDQIQSHQNLRRMLLKAHGGGYTRPAEITYDSHPYDAVYFDWMSFHNYNTCTYRKAFQDVLDELMVEDLQPQPYDWFLGEFGFALGLNNSSETDQAKFFESNLQIIDQFYDDLKGTRHKLKGLGIWSVFDYEYLGEPGHFGLIKCNAPPYEKRQSAYVVENFFEGLIDNANFEIGRDSRTSICQGWAPWSDASGPIRAKDYSMDSPGGVHGKVLRLNGSPGRRIGFSSTPGRKVRVKPGTFIQVQTDVTLNKNPGKNARIFLHIPWLDKDERLMDAVPYDSANQVPKSSLGWRSICQTFVVPNNACYAALYLMGWYMDAGTRILFDNVRFTPEWKPLIIFTFGDDLQRFTSDSPSADATGWTAGSKVERNNGIVTLPPGGVLTSTIDINAAQVTAIRVRHNHEYSVTAIAKSSAGGLKLYSLISDANDYPRRDTLVTDSFTDLPLSVDTMSIVSTNSINSHMYDWVQVQLENRGGMAQFREITVFERNPDYYYGR